MRKEPPAQRTSGGSTAIRVPLWRILSTPATLSTKHFRIMLLLCFFLSGACGLIYEVAWLRVLGLVFGNTTFATSTVLAGYMAGLGLGALWWGKRIDRGGDPVRIYGKLEAGIGLYALLTPLVWKMIDWLTIGFYRFISPAFFTALLFKFTIAFAALVFPTFLMGATLPVLSKYFVTREETVAKEVGLLYGLNTFGAVLGVLFSGFIALQCLGVWQTVYLTGVLNFLIFYFCRHFSETVIPVPRRAPAKPRPVVTPKPEASGHTFSPKIARILLIMFGVSGAVSMMYEIVWTRVLAMSLGSSVYAFSLMLATFLLGISLGSYVFSKTAFWIRPDLRTFGILELLTALFGILGINVFNDMPYYFVRVFAFSRGSNFILDLGRFCLCSLVMLPPTLIIGAIFACFIHILRREKPLGTEVGQAYFANTIGTILGSVLTGFCMIPLLGLQKTLGLAAELNATIGILCFFLLKESFAWKRHGIFAIVLIAVLASGFTVRPWDRGFISSDLAVKPASAVNLNRKQLSQILEERNLLFYKEGLNATVTVSRIRDNLSMSVNGKVDASDRDTFTQFLLGHLPMAIHPDPKKVCIIGLGSGSTAAAVASYPVEQIDMIELEKEVIDAAGYFSVLNRNVLADPRLKLHINDGRNFLLLNPEHYDVIISEPSNPWMAGVANLFSLEHYKTMKKRLVPGGIVCQWLHAYSMSPADLRMIVRTFSEVFPNVSLWTSYYPDLMLLGSNEPVRYDMETIEKSFAIPDVQNDLKPHGILTPAGLFSNAWLFDADLRTFAKNGRINSDNHPYLEFSAPRSLYRSTLEENFMILNMVRDQINFPEIRSLEPLWGKNIAFYNALARGYLAKHFNTDAKWAIGKAQEIDSLNAETLLFNGILHYQTGEKLSAREFLTRASKLNPASAEAQEYLGRIAQDFNDDAVALAAFQKATTLDPARKTSWLLLSDVFFRNGQFLPSLVALTRALEIDPWNFEGQTKKTALVMKLGTPQQKMRTAEEFLERYPRFPGAYEWKGLLLEKNGSWNEALALYKDMAKYFPENVSAYIALARVSDALQDADAMKYYLRKATRLNPSLSENPDIQKLLHR